jgi:hypothetical protein
MKKQSSTIILNNFKMVINVSVFLGSLMQVLLIIVSTSLLFWKKEKKPTGEEGFSTELKCTEKSKRKYLRDLFSWKDN